MSVVGRAMVVLVLVQSDGLICALFLLVAEVVVVEVEVEVAVDVEVEVPKAGAVEGAGMELLSCRAFIILVESGFGLTGRRAVAPRCLCIWLKVC